jgi:single-strand DNA-binding protein
MSINRVTISGNITRDPELRASKGGMQILNFGVAVNERRQDKQSGEWSDYAHFVDCVMFGNRAEALSRYLAKGTKVAIEGKLQYSSWEQDGKRRSKLEVVVNELEFMSRGDNHQGYQQQAPAYTPTPTPVPTPAPQPAPQQAPMPVQGQVDYAQYTQDIPF